MTKSQVFFWLLVAFLAGVLVASFVRVPVAVFSGLFVLGGALVAFSLMGPERKQWAIYGWLLIVFAFGVFWYLRAGERLPSPLDATVGGNVRVEGLIAREPVKGPRSQQLLIRRRDGNENILIFARPYPEYRYGDVVAASGRIERPERFSDDFDYPGYLAKDDIFFTMSFPEVELMGRDRGNAVLARLFWLKSAFSEKLDRLFPEPHAAFMAGLILGERRGLGAELTEDLQRSGTSHIVALSGYNITIVADAFYRTLTFFFVPFAWAFWIAIAGISGFTLLTGAAASVVRAAIMGALVLIARRSGRIYRMRNALTFAAAAMVLHNPKIVRFDVAFALSFLATLGLLYGAPMVERGLERARLRLIPPLRDAGLIRQERARPRRPHRKSFLKETAVATLSAQLFVLPFLVYRFGRLSLVSPFTNLAIVPLIPATMFFGFLSGGVAFVSELLGRVVAIAGWALVAYELSAIRFFSGLPLASLVIPGAGLTIFIGGYALIGWWLRKSKRAYTNSK